MPKVRSFLVGLLLVATAFAGCLGDDGPATQYDVQASSGHVANGWAYDGAELESSVASLEGSLDAETNTGSLNITYDAWGSTWEIRHSQFQGSQDFHDGGIALDVTEHGDSGVGHTEIPRIDGLVLTWGTAEVLRDGEPYEITQTGTWSAHMMFNENTIRGPGGQILQEDQSAPFDPSNPGNAYIEEDNPQALIELTSPGGAEDAREDATVSESIEIVGHEDQGSTEIPTSQNSQATINITTEADSPLQGGSVMVEIVDEEGEVLAEDEGEITPAAPYEGSWTIEDLSGPVQVVVSGSGTYTANVDATVAYDDHPHITITWDDYDLTPR